VAKYTPTAVINERAKPRVLLWVPADKDLPFFDWVEERAGTYRRVRQLDEVDLAEWDVVVTNQPYAVISDLEWGLNRDHWVRMPDDLYIFRVFGQSIGKNGLRYFEFNVSEEGRADTDNALVHGSDIAGHTMLRVGDLPEVLQDLVQSTLVPAVESRTKQFGILRTSESLEPAILNLRPFLIGPTGVLIGASYDRPKGKPIWLLPKDTMDLSRWFDAALGEWHVKDPSTFPNISSWQTDPAWDTAEEKAAREVLTALDLEFAEVMRNDERARAQALAALEEANTRATSGPKSLLTAQGDILQAAVQEALEHLGFIVMDMDQIWADRERREDFRIKDPDDPDWLVLADATGVVKGAPGSKISTLLGYVNKFLVEERPESPPGIWVLVNRLIQRDPATRGDLYREDELAVLADQAGLSIDTVALFVLTQTVRAGTAEAAACRAWLRTKTGQVTLKDAREWLDAL
jgi:hypothetical protein